MQQGGCANLDEVFSYFAFGSLPPLPPPPPLNPLNPLDLDTLVCKRLPISCVRTPQDIGHALPGIVWRFHVAAERLREAPSAKTTGEIRDSAGWYRPSRERSFNYVR